MEHYKTIIEIGSFSIKTIIYSDIDGKPKIEGIGKSNTQGYDGNNVLGFDEFVDSIHNSIVQAEKQSNFIIKSSYILLSNKSIKIKKIKNNLKLDNSIIENNDLRKLSKFNLDKNSEYNQNLYTSHYQIDDNLITDNPIGLFCNKLPWFL